MLSEPKRKQKNITYLHQFVVANHMLVSHIATLSYYTRSLKPEYITADYQPLITTSDQALQRAYDIIEGKETAIQVPPPVKVRTRLLDERIDEMMKERQEEIKKKLSHMEKYFTKLLSMFLQINATIRHN